MNSSEVHATSVFLRGQRLTVLGGALLFVLSFALLGATGGCQGRRETLSAPARILFDSLLAGNEAMYDSASANLGFDRLECLEERAAAQFGLDFVERLGREAEDTVRARRSRTELEAGRRGIEMIHTVGDSVFCKRIDSLWYARIAAKPPAHP